MGQHHRHRTRTGCCTEGPNNALLYSHELLGNTYDLQNPLEEEFSCADLCDHTTTHERTTEDGGTIEFHALTSVDPARRSNGSVFAADLAEAEEKARAAIAYVHTPSILRIEIVEEGNRTTEPSIQAETVNEAFGSVEVFSVGCWNRVPLGPCSRGRVLFDGSHPIVYRLLRRTGEGEARRSQT